MENLYHLEGGTGWGCRSSKSRVEGGARGRLGEQWAEGGKDPCMTYMASIPCSLAISAFIDFILHSLFPFWNIPLALPAVEDSAKLSLPLEPPRSPPATHTYIHAHSHPYRHSHTHSYVHTDTHTPTHSFVFYLINLLIFFYHQFSSSGTPSSLG